MAEMNLNADELAALSFAYTHVYDSYKSIARMRSITTSEKRLRMRHYTKRLLTLQDIIKNHLKVDADFKEIKPLNNF